MGTRKDCQEYTKGIVDLICKNLRGGIPRSECWIGLISQSTFEKWLRVRPEFKEALKIAEFECKKRAIFIIQNAMSKSPQWACWWLERKHNQEFGQKTQQTLNADVKLTDDNARKKLISKLAGITAGGEEKQNIGGTD